jgi:hypothetical protein
MISGMKYFSIFVSVAIFFVAGFMSLPVTIGSVQAQEAPETTLSIVPAIIEKTYDPGQADTFTITLYNRTSQAQPIKVYARNFSARGNSGELTFGEDDATSYAAAKWLTPNQDNLVLDPQGKAEIIVSVDIPKVAEPGGHYASILFEQVLERQAESDQSQVQIAARLAALVFITVSGDVVEAGQILGANNAGDCTGVVCGFTAPKFVDKGPVPFDFIFTNTGNVHVRPRGTITITQFGRQVAKFPVEDRTVLPSSQRKFTTNWQRELLFGPYEATLQLTYGKKAYSLEAKTSLFAFPWQIVLAVVLLLTALGGIFLSRKYYKVKRLVGSAKSPKRPKLPDVQI